VIRGRPPAVRFFDYFFGVTMDNFKKKIKRILRRMLGRPEPPMRKAPNRLPDDIDAAVRKNGLETDGFIKVVESDMDFDGCYLTAWTALDDKGIYFILGDEKVTKKRGNKKIKSEYELREIRSYPLSDFDSLKCEQYVSTGRLIAEKDGDDIGLIKFSLNFLGGYDEFCKAFNSLKTGEPMPQSSEKPSGGVCPKCKRPYSPGRSSCQKCDKNGSTVKRLFSFFGGYKQFGEPVKYSLSNKISNLQHAMAMYFDYSISEYYKERDRQISMGRLEPVTDRKITQQPVVAVWVNTSDSLKKLAYVTDIKRFVLDEYRKMLPSYIIMERNLPKDAYTTQDLLKLSRDAGAEYMLVCGIEGSQAPKEGYWYLTLEQVLFDKNGRMLTLGAFGRKVSPAVGNIQAAGENLWQAREALCEHLPFIVTQHEANLGY
jgi:hypothetical protein